MLTNNALWVIERNLGSPPSRPKNHFDINFKQSVVRPS